MLASPVTVHSPHCGQIFQSRVIFFSFSYLPAFGQKTNKALAVFVYVIILYLVLVYWTNLIRV